MVPATPVGHQAPSAATNGDRPDGEDAPWYEPRDPAPKYGGGRRFVLGDAIDYARGPAPGLRYAGFWIRAASLLIDAVPLTAVAAVSVAQAAPRCAADASAAACAAEFSVRALAVAAAVVAVYWIATWCMFGGSLGQRVLGLRVVRVSDGRQIGAVRAVVRLVGLVIAALAFGIGLFWAGADPQKQGWHDMLARTFVVRRA